MEEEHLRHDPGSRMSDTALSVVVIGRNEGSRLKSCLESVSKLSQSRPTEVIYVDSCSTDDSAVVAAELGAKVIVIKGGRMSAARARNAGWHLASFPFVLFLDGDTILHPDFAAKALAEFERPDIMVVWGHRREIYPEASIYNRVIDLDWIHELGFTEFCGGDAIMRRSMLEQTGGFNAELIAGEEPDLCRRIRALGGLILHIDAPMTGHDIAMTGWGQYWTRALRTGHAYAEIAGRYKHTHDPFWTGESRHNVTQALLYLLAPVIALAAAVLARQWTIALIPLFLAAALIIRTVIKFQHKPASLGTLVLFATHSHLQSIPIFFGQVGYWLNVKRNRYSTLIEYNKGS